MVIFLDIGVEQFERAVDGIKQNIPYLVEIIKKNHDKGILTFHKDFYKKS